MRITKAEIIAISVTLVLLSLMVGFFLGRNTTEHAVVVEAASPEPSEAVETLVASAPVSVQEEIEPTSMEEESLVEETAVETSGLLDLNTATALELETLPGIGEVLAQRIVDYREEIGGFTTLEELKNVEGIGDKKFEALESLVEVGN